MALNSILNTGRSSLLSHQYALQVASNNIANADTLGYAKRDVSFQSLGPSSGVGIQSVQRRAEAFLGGKILVQLAHLGAEDAKASSLRSIEISFSEGAVGLGERLDAFFNSVRSLSTNPTDSQLRSDVLAQADQLSAAFNTTASRLDEERRQVDQALDSLTTRSNQLTQEMADLNRQIMELEASSQEAGDLRDRRDVAARELADLLPITTFEDANGQLTVLLGGGQSLVQGSEASTLSAQQDVLYGGMRRIDLVDPSGSSVDITNGLRDGRIGGLLELRDETLPGMAAEIDQLAFDFVTAVNGAHAAGYGADGGTGRNLFEPVALAGAAGNMALTAGIADNPDWIAASTNIAEAVGGNANLLAIVDIESSKLAGGGLRTFAEEIAEITGGVGRTVQSNRHGLEQAALQLSQLETMRDSQTGVSLDEEMIDITRFQRAYQAGARIVQTVNEMYQTLIQM